MRRAAAGVLALLLALLLMIPAFALPRLDGVDNGSEWRGATQIKLVSGETNSGVNFGLVKYLTDLETQRVFLCFMYIDPAITQENANAGVILTVDDAASILFTVSQPAESPDPYLYSVEGAIAVNEQHGVVCEMCVGVKEGLPAELPVSVRFFDAQGVPSNRYAFLIETGAGQKPNTHAYGDYEAAEDETARDKTTAAATTETLYFKQGAVSYTYPYNYTAAKRTTAAPTTEATTAERMTTMPKTTKEKTTKAAAAPTEAAPTDAGEAQTEPVREVVVVSEVYVTAEPTTGIPPESVRINAKGRTYQTVLIGVAVAVLAALAAFAATSGRRQNRPAPAGAQEETEQHPD
ncbi:MAG: hypothetical protein IK080_02325 [Clostridia bacterium]|nr:hypothetical protein [Clostridia bacterium]